jgi:hypothetical protein
MLTPALVTTKNLPLKASFAVTDHQDPEISFPTLLSSSLIDNQLNKTPLVVWK